ncbi:hypothetical protein KAT08_03150 [Candidatus Babeliales bacterium]|nr:hypothetical protein [Candidatus Babeliales bacterium]
MFSFLLLFLFSTNIILSSNISTLHKNIKVDIYKQSDFQENLSLSSTNTWYEFKIDHCKLQKEKLAWIGSIIFKSKKSLKLKKLRLKWNGNFIRTEKLGASLYQKKEAENIPLPLEKNLICDGKWNKNKQEIIFNLDEKLIAINKYSLIISFPKEIKKQLQKGSFKISNDSLTIKTI